MSLIDGEREPISAVVVQDVQTLRISGVDFDNLLATQPPFARALLRKLASRVRELFEPALRRT